MGYHAPIGLLIDVNRIFGGESHMQSASFCAMLLQELVRDFRLWLPAEIACLAQDGMCYKGFDFSPIKTSSLFCRAISLYISTSWIRDKCNLAVAISKLWRSLISVANARRFLSVGLDASQKYAYSKYCSFVPY